MKCSILCKTCSGTTDDSTSSNCLSCYSGFVLVGGNCKRCNDTKALTCTQSVNSTTFTLSCIPGFTSSIDGICVSCASNCIKCDINKAGSCDQGGCGTGFAQFGSSLLCVACFNGCATCDSDPNVCTSCIPSQYLSNGQCLSCPKYCLSCTSSTYCTTCIFGYTTTGSG